MKVIHKIENTVYSVGFITAWLVIPLVLATIYEVFSRYILKTPTIWSYDIGCILTGAHFLLGGALTLQADEHVRIDLFYSKFSKKKKAVVDLIGYLLLILPVTFFLSFGLFQYALEAYLSGETSGLSAWNPVIWPYRFIFFAGFFLVLLQSLVECCKCLITIRGKVEGESPS